MEFGNIMLTSIATVVGAFLAWIITIHTIKSKKPLWFYHVNPLFKKGVATIPDLSIKYKCNDISNLSSVFFAFWNDGKETITHDMIVDPLRFSSNGKIFDAQVIHSTTKSNGLIVSVPDDQTAVELDFKYLDYKQGAVIQIFSDSSDISDFHFDGAIIGCRKFKNFIYKDKRKAAIMEKFVNLICAVIASTFFLVMFKFTISVQGDDRIPTGNNGLLISSLVFALSAIFLGISVIKYFRDTKYRIPKELRKYFNN